MSQKPTIDLKTWKALYTEAVAFRDLAAWEEVGDDLVYAVHDPISGETGYCCVLGSLGTFTALCIYRGEAGLNLHRKMYSGEIDPSTSDEVIGIQDCIMCEFTDRSDLKKDDLSVIKILGLKFRGSGQWPLFRSHKPCYAPWFIGPEEAQLAILALKAGLLLFRDGEIDQTPDPKERYFTYTWDEKDQAFRTSWQKANAYKPDEEKVEVDPFTLKRVLALPKKGFSIEAGIFFMPGGIIHDKDRPYFARMVLVVEQRSGQIVGMELGGPEDGPGQFFVDSLIKIFDKVGARPEVIEVSSNVTSSVAEVLGEFGLRLEVGDQPMLTEAKESMADHFMGNGMGV